ncbi:MAG: hypothetical protein IH942_09200 [Acidobacteria bacterium]|nr:hypothetical protein [Acidobacteriota bacterium]
MSEDGGLDPIGADAAGWVSDDAGEEALLDAYAKVPGWGGPVSEGGWLKRYEWSWQKISPLKADKSTERVVLASGVESRRSRAEEKVDTHLTELAISSLDRTRKEVEGLVEAGLISYSTEEPEFGLDLLGEREGEIVTPLSPAASRFPSPVSGGDLPPRPSSSLSTSCQETRRP